MLTMLMLIYALSAATLFANVACARPLAALQEEAPQATEYPGFIPEVTSLVASLGGDAVDAFFSAIYGDKSASSKYAQATSAAAVGLTEAAQSWWDEATQAVGDTWWSETTTWTDWSQASETSPGDDGTPVWSPMPISTTEPATATPAPVTTGRTSSTQGIPDASVAGSAARAVDSFGLVHALLIVATVCAMASL